MNCCRNHPGLLVRQVDKFDWLKLPPNQVNMAPCQRVWQEPKFVGLKMDLQPVYSPNDVSSPANHLRYTWSGRPIICIWRCERS